MNDLERKLTGQGDKIENVNFMTRKGNDLGVNWFDLSVNYNSEPYKSDVCIIVTSYYGHLKFLINTLRSYRETGAFVICAFDQPYFGWNNLAQESMKSVFLRPDHILMANSWVFKHVTYDDSKRNGWFWDIKYAEGIVNQFSNFKYVFCVNGDCLWQKPEGLKDVIELLGDGDLISGQSTGDQIHTASVLFKKDAFSKVMEYMTEQMRVPVMGSRSPEVMLKETLLFHKLKEVVAPEQPLFKSGDVDFYSSYNQDSTWKKLLGYRNLSAELDTSAEERLEPPEQELIDLYEDGLYLAGYEQETLVPYYKTGDRRYLLQWWDQSHDDYRYRKYLPLEHYGKDPIWE